ncbi:hypothetical protein BDD12DRAFT_810423 [Trichophaea hybrida]|nr:hypothetical protein BDD12DRAFT_810423 [Trichophaea hybrida]
MPSTSAEPSSSPWGQAGPMGAVSLRPHARAGQHRILGKPPGQIPSQLQTSITPSVFGPIRPEWTGPKQSRPVQSRSQKIGDWSDPGPKISWTGPGLDWTVPVRTGPLLDWWNH